MRGFLQPAHRLYPSEVQSAFAAMSRHRRSRIARDAKTSLHHADEWGRGKPLAPELAAALEAGVHGVKTHASKKKKNA